VKPDVDVLIVGAGLSGIGAAAHLARRRPSDRYVILEQRNAIGGTWDLFRYPGIRSDSDLHTFCYAFKPWLADESIADGPSILRYVQETAEQYGVSSHIRFNHTVREASWSTDDGCWTVLAERGTAAEPVQITARWLFCAGGYYRYEQGHAPTFPGADVFAGTIVHPQRWPEDLDWSGRRVVVIGSGATAVTLVPALAEKAAHVTMLQRTPTYVVALPAVDPVHAWLRRRLGPRRAHRLVRWKNVRLDRLIYGSSRRYPTLVRRLIRAHNVNQLPDGFDVDSHFNPPYSPWDQRMCAAQDGDLFQAISSGRASVATDQITRFTEHGIELCSGASLHADLIVTATGIQMVPLGGITYTVDSRPVELSQTVTYKGMMLGGVPNLVYALGYTNASWTLKVDLICEHFCRLLDLMDLRGDDYAVPHDPEPGAARTPLVDLGSGYVRRASNQFPKQGPREPWLLKMDYLYDRKQLLRGPLADHMSLCRVRRERATTDRDPEAAGTRG
jgi:cation diffusion facilitator CzcD-associated flavoprotein CzcO